MDSIIIRGKEINYLHKPDHFKEVESGIWESRTFDVLDRFLGPGKVFFDIGAWIGTLSIYAAKLGAIVKSYEPDPVAKEMLFENVMANETNGTIIINGKAVGKDWGELKLYGCNGDSMSSPVQEKEHFEIVQVIPFHDILHDEIDLIKIDTEGGEVDILTHKSLSALIAYNLPSILLSVHPALIPDFEQWWVSIMSSYSKYYDIETVDIDCCLFTKK